MTDTPMVFTQAGIDRMSADQLILIDQNARMYRARAIDRPVRDTAGTWWMPTDEDADEYDRMMRGED